LPPFANINAPAVAPSGLPVIAIQWRAWSGGFWVRCAERRGREEEEQQQRQAAGDGQGVVRFSVQEW